MSRADAVRAGPSSPGTLDRMVVWLDRLDHMAATCAALALFSIMMIVFFDVLLRYVFNKPFSWSYDFISIYLMGAAFFLVLSEAQRRSYHVSVDILYLRLSLRARQFWKLVGSVLAFALFGMICYLAVRTGWSRWEGDNVVAGAIAWPTWIPAAIASAGFLLILARLALAMVALGLALATGRTLDASLAGEDVSTSSSKAAST